MKDQSRTKQVRIQELVTLRKRIAELERLESDRTLTETEQQHVEGLEETHLHRVKSGSPELMLHGIPNKVPAPSRTYPWR